MFEIKELGPAKMDDNIKTPKHYQLDGLKVESKDVIKSLLGIDGYINWCWGNVLKYIFRWRKKNGLEDLKKAREILDWVIEIESGRINE